MSNPLNRTQRAQAPRRQTRLNFLLIILAAASCLTLVAVAATHAQSGRKKSPTLSPVPTPTPEPVVESESESRPKRTTSDVSHTFSVHRLDDSFAYVDFSVEELVMNSFFERLTRNKDIAVTRGEKITRRDAQERAKKELDIWVVLVDLEEETLVGGRTNTGVGQGDTRLLSVKTYVYEPKTGTLKYVDVTQQRPYRQATTIGGVRIPVPTPRTIERFPNELQLEQAARDAADRIMLRFKLRLPPDN